MSSRLQQALLQHEETPPQGVWEKITAELDDSASGLTFPSLLLYHTENPPESTWSKITDTLDKSSLSAKLYEAEVAPPAAAWAAITKSLDNGKDASFAERRKWNPLYRYAAAAAIIAAITYGALQLINKKEKEPGLAIKENPVPALPTQPPTGNDNNTLSTTAPANTVVQTDETRDDAALEASKKTFARLDINKHSRLKNVADYYFTDPISSVQSRGFDISETAPAAQTITDTDPANRYITLTNREGYIIRVSKKLGDLACCVSGEEQDENCKGQMKKWREKIATSCGNHSPGNFMDILGLVSTLQENDQ